eukprot:4079669-Pyramimonas_sp.AAC.1
MHVRDYGESGPSPTRRQDQPCQIGYILTTDQSDAGSAGIFSRRPNQMPEVCKTCIPWSRRSGAGPRGGPAVEFLLGAMIWMLGATLWM